MLWLKQVIAALLDWFTALSRENTKSSDADKTPDELKNKWRDRILEVEKKRNEDSKNNSTD